MGNACQKFLAALLVPTGALHRFLQLGGHLIESAAYRGKFVLSSIGDLVVQIAVSKLARSLTQQVKRFFDLTDHEPGEKAIGHQDGQKNHKNQADGRQREDDFQSAVQMDLFGSKEV